MFVSALAGKQPKQVEFHGERFGHTDLITSGEGDRAPHAFVVDQPPEARIPTHFHAIDQFQVFIAGGGTIGRKPIEPVTVHYTNAYTGYGPIIAGPEGLRYLTLRPRHRAESRAQVLPDQKQAQNAAPRRHRLGAVVMDKPGPRTTVDEQVILPREEDGLFAASLSVPPGHIVKLPDCAGMGRFVLVLAGSVAVGGTVSDALSCVFAFPEERPVLEAGSEGAELVVLDYPTQS
ncbi:hypothetical protein [Nocardioides pyridinolyticus]